VTVADLLDKSWSEMSRRFTVGLTVNLAESGCQTNDDGLNSAGISA